MCRSIRAHLALGCILVGASNPAFAATFVVDRFDDPFPDAFCDNAIPNDCSLRDATLAANANAGPDIIQLPAGTYLLTRTGSDEDAGLTGDLDVLGPVAIQGADETETIIEAGGSGGLNDRVFDIGMDVVVEMSDFTIRGGVSSLQGGGIKSSGNTTLTRVTLSENESMQQGGAIWNGGSMTVLESTVSGNTGSRAGGIDSDGTLVIHDSSILGNEATGAGLFGGGGLLHFFGSTTVTESTIDGNHATNLPGGGIYATGGIVLIEDSRITSNRSEGSLDNFAGAGLALVNEADVTIRRTTIDGNRAIGEKGGGIAVDFSFLTIEDSSIVDNESDINAGGIYIDTSDVDLVNSTLAKNSSPLDGGVVQVSSETLFDISTIIRNGASAIAAVSGLVTFRDSVYDGTCSGGANFVFSMGNVFSTGSSCGGVLDIVTDGSFLLSTVGDHGGPTPTAVPFADSPAIDIALTCPPPDFDQRGELRPVEAGAAGVGGGCDAGSVEVQADELDALFFDGFESGDTSIWSSTQ